MKIEQAINIFFSPTGTTKKIVTAISTSLNIKNNNEINLTNEYSDLNIINIPSTSIAIIGIPVYRGGLPFEAVKRLNQISGKKTPAIINVIYGNRDYDNALIELKQIISRQGFVPIAEGAFIGEHSFSSREYPIAANRPDKKDLESALTFGQMISKKINSQDWTTSELSKQDYIDIKKKEPLRVSPIVDINLCDNCGRCKMSCPTGSIINSLGKITTKQETCITCMACVKTCHNNARSIQDQKLLNIIKMLHDNNQKRKEPAFKLLI